MEANHNIAKECPTRRVIAAGTPLPTIVSTFKSVGGASRPVPPLPPFHEPARRRLSAAAKSPSGYHVVAERAPQLAAPPSQARRRLSSPEKPSLGVVTPSPTRRRMSSTGRPSPVHHPIHRPTISPSPGGYLSPVTNVSPVNNLVVGYTPRVVVTPAHGRRRLSSPEKPALRDVSPSLSRRRMSSAGNPSQANLSRNPDWRCLFNISTPRPVPHRLARPAVFVAESAQEHHPIVELPPPTIIDPTPTVSQLFQALTTSVQSLDLGRFYTTGDARLLELSRKAAALAMDKLATLNKPEDLAALTNLALFDTVVYCDDSGSMQHGDRIAALKEYVRRVTKITTMLDTTGISIRFINFERDEGFNGIHTISEVEEVMDCAGFCGGTRLGTELERKILNPLLFAKTRNETLEKPLLITIVTDGAPVGEELGHFRNAILNCKRTLKIHGYSSRSAVFQLGQVGDENDAEAFIRGLHNDPEIGSMVYCTSDRLDTKIAGLKDNDTEMERWLLNLMLGGLTL